MCAPWSPSVDVLVVTRNADLVLDCLAHLSHQTIPHTVFVADNGAEPGACTDAVRTRFPAVRTATNDRNLGFGRAVNDLARVGDGEIIVLINDDLNVDPDFLQAIAAPFADASVGMCAGLSLQPGPGEVVDGFGIELDSTLLAFNRLRRGVPSGLPGVLAGPSGGAAAYRRTAWEANDGFDDSFFAYGEDVDLALRLRLDGWSAAAAPDARGVHLGGATAGIDSPLQRRLAGFARGFILRRYGVMRGRHAPRAALIETLTVLKGLYDGRTLVPLTARLAGWRAAGRTPRLTIPAEAVDARISLRESLRRLRFER